LKSRREICFRKWKFSFARVKKNSLWISRFFGGIISVSASLRITTCVGWVECWFGGDSEELEGIFDSHRRLFVPFRISDFSGIF
jgi:hypothetical protein